MDRLPCKVIGMSNADYHSQNDFLGRSYLHSVAKYGGEAQRWMDMGYSLFGGNAGTRTGSKFDTIVTAVCEGKKLTDVLAIPPAEVLASNGSRRGKAYDAWKEEADRKGLVDCNQEEGWQLEMMLTHLLENPAAKALIEQTNETQVSAFFELNGHRCKVRPDGCTPTLWWDLKTTSSTWDKVYRSAIDFGYAEQEWLYVQGAKALGMDHFRMPFVFVQTMAPYGVHVFYLPTEIVEEAGLRMTRVMEEVRLRRETGVYESADSGEITELQFPAWAKRQEEEVITV
jgi:hypothetical protein